MNRRASQLGLHSTHFERADGLDVAGHVSTAHDLNRLAQIAMRQPVIRELALTRNTSIAGGRSLHTWNDLLGRVPWARRGQDRAHLTRGLVSGRRPPAAPGSRSTRRSSARRPAGERNADLADLLAFGLSRYRLVPVIAAERTYAHGASSRTGATRSRSSRCPAGEAAGPAGPGARGARRRADGRLAPRPQGPAARRGARRTTAGSSSASSPLVASRSVELPGTADKVGWYAKRTLHHLGGLFS